MSKNDRIYESYMNHTEIPVIGFASDGVAELNQRVALRAVLQGNMSVVSE